MIHTDRGLDPRKERSRGSEIQKGSGRSAVEGGSRWMTVNGVGDRAGQGCSGMELGWEGKTWTKEGEQ